MWPNQRYPHTIKNPVTHIPFQTFSLTIDKGNLQSLNNFLCWMAGYWFYSLCSLQVPPVSHFPPTHIIHINIFRSNIYQQNTLCLTLINDTMTCYQLQYRQYR